MGSCIAKDEKIDEKIMTQEEFKEKYKYFTRRLNFTHTTIIYRICELKHLEYRIGFHYSMLNLGTDKSFVLEFLKKDLEKYESIVQDLQKYDDCDVINKFKYYVD
jgi:hypothetical protein